MRDSLAPAHFRVIGAMNGDRGIELARILKPFAITLDIMMPEKDGWQVLREIKADAELCRIPVIVMSIVSERSLGFSLGVTDYLVKPVDRRVLIDVLERLRRRTIARTMLEGPLAAGERASLFPAPPPAAHIAPVIRRGAHVDSHPAAALCGGRPHLARGRHR